MRIFQHLLKEAAISDLTEALKASAFVNDPDLALWQATKRGNNYGDDYYGLFSISEFHTFCRTEANRATGVDSIADKLVVWTIGSIENIRLPFMRAGFAATQKHQHPCYGAAEIVYATALKGYGPGMYELLMGVYGGLISDRTTVSKAARSVWAKFHQRADIEKLPLDDVRDPKTPPHHDDCGIWSFEVPDMMALNYAYRLTDGDAATAQKIANTLLQRGIKALQEEGIDPHHRAVVRMIDNAITHLL